MAVTAAAAAPLGARSAHRRRRLLGAAATAALALGSVVTLPSIAQAAQTPSFTTAVTEVADERIDIAIEGSGYGDVQALPGQTEPHAYFTLIEKDADLTGVGQADTAVSASVETDGTISTVLSVPADELDASTEYEVISWPSRSFPTGANLYARTDITIDWAALFPVEEPTWSPQLTVTPATDLDPEGDTVSVTGTGYNPAQGLYVFLCADVDLPADLWQLALSCRSGAALVTPAADGTFELDFAVSQLNDAPTAVYTAANHTAQADRTQDAKARLAFAEPVEPQPEHPVLTLTGPDGEELTSVTQGDDVTFSLSPVEAGTEFEVVIHSDEVVLPDLAVAGADGVASATWTVADDFEPGEHTVTFTSGSVSYSAAFRVIAADVEPGGSDDGDSDDNGAGVDSGSGAVTAAGDNAAANGKLAVTGADGVGIALSAAALLMLVGAGVLVLARRRAVTTDQA